ncbi:MAG: alcohol dehydrogenase catalytic domain-containing protein, partial [Planctomycetes bacterium]|nr:alcohol dehydrogenase catalytic domain-containing protein [Planctomycetota bacterium]
FVARLPRMRACAITAPRRLELLDVAAPELGPFDVRIRPAAVGVCGTDFHIFAGESNFRFDQQGRQIPFEEQPQVLGHEITGTVIEVGKAVHDLRVGARVVVDQGRNCVSERRDPRCEYCATGHSHQCEFFEEHGITGLPGGFAEELVTPAINCVEIRSELPFAEAVMTEPIGCVLHSTDFGVRANTRYRLDPGAAASERVRTVAILGAGPAGLLFVQVLRAHYAFDGPIVISDPSPHKRALAARLGAIAVPPEELQQAVLQHSHGRRAELLVEATGCGHVFPVAADVIRKQATVLLYGVGHGTAPLEHLTLLQWKEAVLITTVGASGGFDDDGTPTIYRQGLELLERGAVQVRDLVTHRYAGLAAVPDAFTGDSAKPDYVKGIATLAN